MSGVLFWNLGDSYAGGGNGGGGSFAKDGIRAPQPGSDKNVPFRTGSRGVTETSKSKRIERGTGRCGGGNNFDVSLKAKDLVLMPARIALAAQADGWWVRSMIVWAKPNPMPESVTDRPADSYEYILMLTKSAHYFWDADAVREKGAPESLERAKHGWHGETDDGSNGKRSGSSFRNSEDSMLTIPLDGRRNMRNVWNFATQPYGAHFATFPEELPRRCILAATSARGACRQCGALWERIVNATGGTIGRSWHDHQNDDGLLGQQIADPLGKGMQDASHGRNGCEPYELETVGWSPTCRCRGQHGRTVPCVVLDPFAGSGTTGRVAIELNRRAVPSWT